MTFGFWFPGQGLNPGPLHWEHGVLTTGPSVCSVAQSLSRVQLFMALWTVAHQAPLSIEFSGQEYWSGLPFPSPGDLPDPMLEPGSPALQMDSLPSEPPMYVYIIIFTNVPQGHKILLDLTVAIQKICES